MLVLGLKEFYQLAEKKDAKPQKTLGFVMSIGLYVSSYILHVNEKMSYLTLNLVLALTFLYLLLNFLEIKELASLILTTILGVIYVALLSLLVLLSTQTINTAITLF